MGEPLHARPAPGDVQLLIAYYTAARNELLQRISQRDQVLVLFLGVVGAVFTVCFASLRSRYPVFLVLPYLGLGATYVTMQHNSLIYALGHYCRVELDAALRAVTPVPGWDASQSRARIGAEAFRHRRSGHLLLLVGPQVVAVLCAIIGLAEQHRMSNFHRSALIALIAGGAVPPILSSRLIVRSYHIREAFAAGSR